MKNNISVLISEEDINKRVKELGAQIKKDYEGKELILVGILKGSVMFMVDLSKRLDPENTKFEFMEVSSYGDEEVSSGVVKINKDLTIPITDKHVLLIEDIIDTGNTLASIIRHLESQNPASLKICTLLDKPDRREQKNIQVDYLGFSIPNKFVVGYGLDYGQLYRNLPYVGVVN